MQQSNEHAIIQPDKGGELWHSLLWLATEWMNEWKIRWRLYSYRSTFSWWRQGMSSKQGQQGLQKELGIAAPPSWCSQSGDDYHWKEKSGKKVFRTLGSERLVAAEPKSWSRKSKTNLDLRYRPDFPVCKQGSPVVWTHSLCCIGMAWPLSVMSGL